ncbi:MAG: hypothetical protein WB507_12240 [Solirubrobacterales bacterium]
MRSVQSYERVLGALVAEARVGRIARMVTGDRDDAGWSSQRAPGGRAWINGKEVGPPNPRFTHLGRNHD